MLRFFPNSIKLSTSPGVALTAYEKVFHKQQALKEAMTPWFGWSSDGVLGGNNMTFMLNVVKLGRNSIQQQAKKKVQDPTFKTRGSDALMIWQSAL